MKHNLDQTQQEILLRRHANQTRLTSLPAQSRNRIGRVVLETFGGLISGVPFGISLYYVILVMYHPVMMCLGIIGLAFSSTFHVPAASVDLFAHELNFGTSVDVLLAVLALACCFYFTRGAIGRGYQVFAWVQLPLTLSVVLTLFYLTMVLHKPLLPFYGQ